MKKTLEKHSIEKVPSDRMMDEKKFWAIIDESLQRSRTQQGQERFLLRSLKTLTPTEIIEFDLRRSHLHHAVSTDEMRCGGALISLIQFPEKTLEEAENAYFSDDCFEYFCYWVISRGEGTYYAAKENPDNLINELAWGGTWAAFEGFAYVAMDAFTAITGMKLCDYVVYPESEQDSQEFEPDDSSPMYSPEIDGLALIEASYPRLFELAFRRYYKN